MKDAQLAIIGAGPIGLELAIACKRAGIDYLHFDRGQIAETISWFPPLMRFFSSNERIALAGVPIQTTDQSKCTREEYLAYLRTLVVQFDLAVRTYEQVVSIEGSRGGFELRTLVHLDETVEVLRQRINPQLAFVGAVITNCHLRRNITEEVHAEVARHYTVLGQVRAEARLLYATTSGKVYHLVRSKALDDYRRVVQRLKESLPWLARR